MIVEARRDVVMLRGSLDKNEWPTIQAAAKLLLEEHPSGIIIDCSQLSEVTEVGAKTFHDAINYIQQHDAKIIVAGLPDSAVEVISRVRAVMSQLPITPTVDDARASLGLEDLSAQSATGGLRTLAVLLVGDWEHAMRTACLIVDRRRDELHMIDFLRVPRVKPLHTPMPEQEAMARRKLEDSDRIARQCKVRTIRHVERVRSAAEGMQRVITTLKPSKLILSVGHIDESTSDLVNQVMPNLLSDPPCEIIYSRLPVATED